MYKESSIGQSYGEIGKMATAIISALASDTAAHDSSWRHNISMNQIAFLVESLAFFVVGCLSLLQASLLLNSHKSQAAPAGAGGGGWNRNAVDIHNNYTPIAAGQSHSSYAATPSPHRPQQQQQSRVVGALTGGTTRAVFIACLCVASFVRAISLVLIALWVSPPLHKGFGPDNDINDWNLYLLQSFPALLFLTAYSVVVLFWAQVYYATLLVSVPFLLPVFAALNFIAMAVFVVVAALTRSLGHYGQFRVYALSFVGLLHLLIAGLFVYFGVQVAAQFANQEKPSKSRDSIIRRVVFLSFVCPLIFAIRGMLCLCFVFNVIQSYYPTAVTRFSWDAIIFLVTELIPAVLILVSFWPSSSSQPSSPLNANSPLHNDFQSPLLDNHLLGDLRVSLDRFQDDYRCADLAAALQLANERPAFDPQRYQNADPLYDPDLYPGVADYLNESHGYRVSNRNNFQSQMPIPRMCSPYNPRNWNSMHPQPNNQRHNNRSGNQMIYDPPASSIDKHCRYIRPQQQQHLQQSLQPKYNVESNYNVESPDDFIESNSDECNRSRKNARNRTRPELIERDFNKNEFNNKNFNKRDFRKDAMLSTAATLGSSGYRVSRSFDQRPTPTDHLPQIISFSGHRSRKRLQSNHSDLSGYGYQGAAAGSNYRHYNQPELAATPPVNIERPRYHEKKNRKKYNRRDDLKYNRHMVEETSSESDLVTRSINDENRV